MVLDNQHYQHMIRNFPRNFQPRLNRTILANKLGIQAYIAVTVFGAIWIYGLGSLRNVYPYVFVKTRKEYKAIPDYFTQSVIIQERQVQNKMENL